MSDLDRESYVFEDVAIENSPEVFVEVGAFTLAASLYTASEMLGHNNATLVELAGYAQQEIADDTDLLGEFKPFEVDAQAVADGTAYLGRLTEASAASLAQAKASGESAETISTFKHIDNLIKRIGTADDYSKVVF